MVNGKRNVPKAIRAAVDRCDFEEIVSTLINAAESDLLESLKIEEMVQELKRAIERDSKLSAGQKTITNIENNHDFLVKAYILSLTVDNNVSETKTSEIIWEKGVNYVDVIYGDIFTFGFNSRKRSENIVVIPVNTTFEVQLTSGNEKTPYPLVSPKTLHGMWLSKMFSCNYKENDIEKMIENGMENVDTASVGISAIPIGRQSDYPIGTISAVAHSSNTFYLLAISRNDEYGNSVSSKNDIESAMNNLLTYYNRFGQGYHLYLPLLGTGRSRAGLSHQESYELIIQTMKKNKNKINGEITIVVHPKDKNYVAIKKGDAFDDI